MAEEQKFSRKPSRFSAVLTYLRTISTASVARISGWNERLAAKFKTTRERVFQLELGGLLAFGFTMMQIGEWAGAIGSWILLACILFAKAMAWEGVKGNRGATAFGRMAFVAFILIGCTMLIMITDFRKPDSEPWSNLQKWNWPGRKPPCSISVDVTSTMIAMVHLRAMWHPSGSGRTTDVYKPVFQDLYHDWIINLTPTGNVSQVVVSITDGMKPVDNIKTLNPKDAVISEPKPKWLYGFEEPSQIPDSYTRTATFEALKQPETITIRRPIKAHGGVNTITNLDLNLDRNIDVSAESCKVVFTPTSRHNWPLPAMNPHFNYLVKQMQALIARSVFGPVATRLDPDDPYPPLAVDESEQIDQVTCKDSECYTKLVEMKEHTRIH